MLPLKASFPNKTLDIFMFVNRESELDQTFNDVLSALQPVAVRTYDMFTYLMEAPKVADECFCSDGSARSDRSAAKAGHFSFYGAMFWGVYRCFGMVFDHERVRLLRGWSPISTTNSTAADSEGGAVSSTSHLYKWIVRARPDLLFTPLQYVHLRRVTHTQDVNPLTDALVWFRRAHVSDIFALVTRAAADSYRSVWDELWGGCLTLPSGSERSSMCSRLIQVRQNAHTQLLYQKPVSPESSLKRFSWPKPSRLVRKMGLSVSLHPTSAGSM